MPFPLIAATVVACLLVCPVAAYPQAAAGSSSLNGRVTDAAGQPLPGALVTIEGTTHEATTDPDGAFRIEHVPPGRHTLRVSLAGFEPSVQIIDNGTGIGIGELPPLRITLAEGGYLFEQVQVVEDGYAVKRSLTSTRTNTDLRDIPQSIQVLNKDLFQDQGATYLNDALRNVSGVTMFSEYLDFNMRGFRTQADGAVKVDGLNQVQDTFVKPRLLNVERVEVVKGPAGALYGTSKPGGFVNIITKQPSAERAASVALQLGSWDKSEIHGSVNGPVPAAKNLFYRIDAAHIDNEGFRRFEHVVYSGLTGAVTWAPQAKTSVTVGGEWFDDSYGGHRNRGIAFYEHRLLDLPSDFTVNEPDDRVAIDASTARARLLHQFSDRWRVDAAVSYLSNSSIQQYHEPMGLRPGGRLMTREFRDQYREKEQTAANANLAWNPTWARIQHTVLIGGEYTLTNGLLSSGTARDSSRGGPVPDLDIYDPVYGTESRPLRWSYYGANVPGGITALSTSTNNRIRASGLYAQDQVALGTRVSLLAGVRYDEFQDKTRSEPIRSRTGDAISLRAGGVVHASTQWSFYGNFSEGFEPPSATLSLDPARYGGPFDPETSWSLEGGVKGYLLDNRVTTTVAIYQITKHDMLLQSPTPDLPDRYVPVGAFESRGVEVDVAGRLSRRMSLYANYAHSFLAEVTRDVNPANIGKAAENNPSHSSSVWARYDLLTSDRLRLGVGGGVSYVGRRLTAEAGDILPAYTKLDAAVMLTAARVGVTLNLFNLTDQRYFTGGYGGRIGGFLGAPRGYDLRLSYRF